MNQSQLNFASIGKRLVALIIDGIILSVVAYIFFDEGYSYTGPGLYNSLIQLVVAWLYFAIQDSSSHQATFGKRAMDIHISGPAGQKVDFKVASIRYFGKLLSSFILLIGYFMAMFSSEKQTLHDRLANTWVVEDQ